MSSPPPPTSRKRKLSPSTKSKTKSKAKAPPVEKRAARYRSAPTSDVLSRIQRALDQRLYLLHQKDKSRLESESTASVLSRHYAVLGSTGNVYDVHIDKTPCCTCPDFIRGHLCKHILFVFLKVLKVPTNSPLIYQKALLNSELEEIFTNAPESITASVNAKACVSEAYRASVLGEKGGEEEVEAEEETAAEITGVKFLGEEGLGECAVCFDTMQSRAEATACPTCKNSLHAGCLRQWLKHSLTCVYCRSPLVAQAGSSAASTGGTGSGISEGYVNLGDLQGQSRVREVSNSYGRYRRGGW